MKKIIASALFIGSFLTSFSQSNSESYSKGNLFVTGGLSFESTSQGNVKVTEFGLLPQLGYFVNENIAVGVNLGLMQSKEKDSATNVSDNLNTQLGAFARYYFNPKNKFSVFCQAGLNYNVQNDKIAKSTVNSFDFSISPAINYFLSDHFSIEAAFGKIGFNNEKANVENAVAKKKIDFNVNLNAVNFSLNYKF